MCIKIRAPKTFLHWFSLKFGAEIAAFYGLITSVIAMAGAVPLAIDVQKCSLCPTYVMRSIFAYSIHFALCAVVMVIVHLTFIYGLIKRQLTVILTWLIIQLVWLVEAFILWIVFFALSMQEFDVFFANVFGLLFGFIYICIQLGLWFAAYAYYVDLTRPPPIITLSSIAINSTSATVIPNDDDETIHQKRTGAEI